MTDKSGNKRYESSKNLCKKFRIKNSSTYVVDEQSKDVKFFCSTCRKLHIIPNVEPYMCPVCMKKSINRRMLSEGYQITIKQFKHVDAMAKDYIDSVTINKSWQDGKLKDENVTILYRDYMWSDGFKLQQSFSRYKRMIVSFENQQLYFTEKASGNKHVNFSHYESWASVVAYDEYSIYSKFKKYVHYMVDEVYANYGLTSIYDGTSYNAKSLSTVGFLYNCLKFPIVFKAVMQKAAAFNDNYVKESQGRKTINNMCYWLYLGSKIDSKLLHTLCATNEDVYIDNLRNICAYFDKPDELFDFCINNPLGIVFAENLHHYGFLHTVSVIRLADKMANVQSQYGYASIWLYEFFYKRNHSRRKFWKRMLTKIDEVDLIDMILTSNITSEYECYICGGGYGNDLTYSDIQKFYDSAVEYLTKYVCVGSLDTLVKSLT